MRYIIFLSLLCPLLSNCQPITLKGKVINEQMEPIAGATITLKRPGNNQPPSIIHQLSSDAKGKFTITNLFLTDTLIITAIGYQTAVETLDFNSRGLITVILKRRTALLEEIVVNTGYQQLPKERATGSFTQLNNQALNQQTGSNIVSRLNGVASSVAFDNSPNRPPLTIRGLSTINGPKSPLIVLDNFPFDGDIGNINPADVESITLLKDAAAASIWGARAGNGVIIITTKKAKLAQPLQIDWSSALTLVQKPSLDYLKPMTASDFIDVEQFLFGKGYYNASISNTGRPVLSPVVEILVKQSAGQLSAADAGVQINALRDLDVRNDYDKYVYQPAINQQYALQLKGGSDKATYLFSGGFDKNRNELDAPYSRLSFRTDNTFLPFKNFRLTTSVLYTGINSASGRTPYGVLLQSTKRIPPYTQLAAPDGTPLPLYNYRQAYIDTAGAGKLLDWRYYPLDEHKHNYTTTAAQLLSGNFGMQYKFLSHFTVSLAYRYDRQQTTTDNMHGKDSYFTRDLVNRFTQINRNTGVVTYIIPNAAVLDKSNTILQAHNFRSQLNYDLRRHKSSLTAIAGSEVRQTEITGASSRYYGFNPDLYTSANVDYINTYPTFITGAKQAIPSSQQLSSVTNRFVSIFANAAYTWNDRYTASASARRDASNLFGVKTNDKWKPLWSAGLAWHISNESFYHVSHLPYLKLRFTYGFSGNMDASRSAVTTMRYAPSAAPFTNYTYASVNQFANPSLRWEQLRTINAALDFGTKNSIITGTVEYYIKKGTDLFGSSPIDYTSGLALLTITRNVAGMKGKGVDLTVNTLNINKKIKWATTALFSYNTSAITSYYLANTIGANYLNSGTAVGAIVGKPLYSIITYKWAGLDTLGNPQGWLDGKPVIDYTAIKNKTQITDLVFAGSAIPRVWGSLLNTVSWNRLSLSVNITYKIGYAFKKESINYVSLFSQGTGNADFALRWQQPGDEKFTTVPSMIYPANANRETFYNSSDALIRKGDHIRLQFINLLYDCISPKNKRAVIKQMQLYVNAADLGIIWKANKDGIDPDYDSDMPPGISTTLGLRASF